MALSMTIVGLGLVGSSIGLALKQARAEIEIVGHDQDSSVAKRAHKAGAVDRTEWNLITACEGAGLILLSTPLSEVKKTLKAVASYLKQGCVVTDTASLKVPVLQWARESLPDTSHFIGGHPIINKPGTDGEAPSAELLSGSVYCLTPSSDATPEALQSVSGLAEAVGAKPYFLDAAEHDGLITAVEQMPLLLALVLQETAGTSPSRREMIQLSGHSFLQVTGLLTEEARTLAEPFLLNSDNAVRWLDALAGRISDLRSMLAKQDREGLQQFLTAVLEARSSWRREIFEGEAVDYSDFGTMRTMFGQAFGRREKADG